MVRRRPASTGSLHDQFEEGNNLDEKAELPSSEMQPSYHLRPSRPQSALLTPNAGLLGPNREDLHGVAQPPYAGVVRSMSFKAQPNTRDPLELSPHDEMVWAGR